jgi:hypothetical protein
MTNGNDRDGYLRWQELAITQLGYTINLFLTLATAMLVFAMKILMESKMPFAGVEHVFFHLGVLLLALSVVAALAANYTRAQDFRYTRRAARPSVSEENRLNAHDRAECYGKCTWWLFYCQTTTFGLGGVLFGVSTWLAYANRI